MGANAGLPASGAFAVAGELCEIPAEVKRIVTLAPDLTETVYALGLGDRLAGDTNFCDTPAAAKAKPHIGDPQNPSLEAIAGLRPDLVLASASINREETVDALERLGIAVYTSDPHTVRGMLDSIARMAEVAGAVQMPLPAMLLLPSVHRRTLPLAPGSYREPLARAP